MEPWTTNRCQKEILRLWDQSTDRINTLWAQILSVYELLLYVVDNEIHHRGQGYVYLRALGIEPPAFFDRS